MFGLLVVFAALAAVHGSRDVPAQNLAAAIAGFGLFLACEIMLIIRTSRCSRLHSAENGTLRAEASKRQARENFIGVVLLAAGIIMETTHSLFGAPMFAGEWAISFALIAAGMSIQMFAQARYIQAIG